MMIPLFPKLTPNIGASHTLAGLHHISDPLNFVVIHSRTNEMLGNVTDNTSAKPESFFWWIKVKTNCSKILDSLNVLKGLLWWEMLDIIAV